MNLKIKLKELLKKYKHAWVFSYALIYMSWFSYLEKHVTSGYYVIHTRLDDYIPFCEYFVVPYLLWFAFLAAVFAWFFFKDTAGFYKLVKVSFTGMTIFLIISTIFPNGQHLRPIVFERDNIFVDLVKFVYRSDTPTNIFPSLHVFNTLAACMAISQSEELRKRKQVCVAAYGLAVLIILSTMFLKQHSVLDVTAAFVMAFALAIPVYMPMENRQHTTIREALLSVKK